MLERPHLSFEGFSFFAQQQMANLQRRLCIPNNKRFVSRPEGKAFKQQKTIDNHDAGEESTSRSPVVVNKQKRLYSLASASFALKRLSSMKKSEEFEFAVRVPAVKESKHTK